MDGFPDIDADIGEHQLLIRTASNQECIKVEFEGRQMYLNDYYLQSTLDKYTKDCPKIAHDHFFKLLDFFSSVLRQTVYLSDSSFKNINACFLYDIILLFVKGRTFYQRYGFQHEKGNDLYKKYRYQPYSVYRNQENINRIQSTNKALRSDVTRNAETERLREVSDALLSPDMTLEEVCTWVYLLCEMKHKLSNSYEFQQIIQNIVNDLKKNKELVNKHYTRPMSMTPYKYTVDTEGRVLHIHLTKTYFKTRRYLCSKYG